MSASDRQCRVAVFDGNRAVRRYDLSGMQARRHPLVRLRRLGGRRLWLIVRASLALAAASATVALLPFRRAVRFGCVPLGQSGLTVGECVWAVQAAAQRLPWRAVCIEQGLAAQRMLRRGGIEAVLHYGARHDPADGRLEAHVWVSVAGRTVLGGDEAPRFAEVAAYP